MNEPESGDEKRKLAFQYFKQAYRKQMKGELDEAIGLYEQSLEVLATAEAHTFLGWTYSFMGRYDDAITECYNAIVVDPTFGNPYNDIGAYMIERGQLDEAIPWLERATKAKRYASYEFPHLNLGRVYERKGDWSKAIQEYKNALDRNPEYTLALRAYRRLHGMLN